MHRLPVPFALAALIPACASADPAELPLSEDFSGSCEWPTRWDGVRLGECADGFYRFELPEPGGPYTAWREFEPSSSGVELEVTADLPQGANRADHGFGLGCWTEVGGTGFLFAVWGDGTVVVFEEVPPSGLTPIFEQATPLPGFRLPARLRVGCARGREGTALSLSVNGAGVKLPAGSRPSEAFSVVGFASGTASGNAEITFDDFAARRS